MNLSKAIRLKLSKLAAFGALTAIPIAATGDGGNKVVLNHAARPRPSAHRATQRGANT